MLLHEKSKPCHLLWDTPIGSLKGIEMSMDTFYPLFSQWPKSHMPFPQPRKHMFLKHMHLWEYCGMWEILVIESHEFLDVITY